MIIKIIQTTVFIFTILLCTKMTSRGQMNNFVVNKVAVEENGLVGFLHLPKVQRKLPGVIVIGGSEGGVFRAEQVSDSLASKGYVCLSLAYFKIGTLPKVLEEIPLEYFKQGIDYLKARAEVAKGRIGLIGTSKGAEAVLLLSSYYPDLSVAVVANVPSHVVWQSVSFTEPKSSCLFHSCRTVKPRERAESQTFMRAD